jgi:hypothetical protein
MRTNAERGHFKASAIAGSRAIMIALNCKPTACKGLLGFAFRRTRQGGEAKWLRSLKVFKTVVPKPDVEHGDYRPIGLHPELELQTSFVVRAADHAQAVLPQLESVESPAVNRTETAPSVSTACPRPSRPSNVISTVAAVPAAPFDPGGTTP